jgi:hypothetical protein
MNETYVCGLCGGTFEKCRSDAEAAEEYHRDFGQGGDEPPAVLCDDCYKWMIDQEPPPLRERV